MAEGFFEFAECPIRWSAWGDVCDPGLVVIHGARADRRWWKASIDAGLAKGRRAVTLDLSGHGDSGRRPDYSPELWADETLAAIENCTQGRAALVGHGMGGLVAVVAAARRPDLVTDVVLVDTKIRIPDGATPLRPRGALPKELRTFASGEEAVGPVEDGWEWKFDPGMSQRLNHRSMNRYLASVECPVSMVCGQDGASASGSSARGASLVLGRSIPATAISGTHHHLILDKPAATAGAIVGALAAADFGRSFLRESR